LYSLPSGLFAVRDNDISLQPPLQNTGKSQGAEMQKQLNIKIYNVLFFLIQIDREPARYCNVLTQKYFP
jgi:hypothetical protein